MLSILILATPERNCDVTEIVKELLRQGGHDIEIISLLTNRMGLFEKRNNLMMMANGEHITFIEDKDWISSTYISNIMARLKEDPDFITVSKRRLGKDVMEVGPHCVWRKKYYQKLPADANTTYISETIYFEN